MLKKTRIYIPYYFVSVYKNVHVSLGLIVFDGREQDGRPSHGFINFNNMPKNLII